MCLCVRQVARLVARRRQRGVESVRRTRGGQTYLHPVCALPQRPVCTRRRSHTQVSVPAWSALYLHVSDNSFVLFGKLHFHFVGSYEFWVLFFLLLTNTILYTILLLLIHVPSFLLIAFFLYFPPAFFCIPCFSLPPQYLRGECERFDR